MMTARVVKENSFGLHLLLAANNAFVPSFVLNLIVPIVAPILLFSGQRSCCWQCRCVRDAICA
jgi:hypothetical protein